MKATTINAMSNTELKKEFIKFVKSNMDMIRIRSAKVSSVSSALELVATADELSNEHNVARFINGKTKQVTLHVFEAKIIFFVDRPAETKAAEELVAQPVVVEPTEDDYYPLYVNLKAPATNKRLLAIISEECFAYAARRTSKYGGHLYTYEVHIRTKNSLKVSVLFNHAPMSGKEPYLCKVVPHNNETPVTQDVRAFVMHNGERIVDYVRRVVVPAVYETVARQMRNDRIRLGLEVDESIADETISSALDNTNEMKGGEN